MLKSARQPAVISLPDAAMHSLARARQDSLIKPQGALGRLEEIACWFAARQGRVTPRNVTPAITVFAADHGVAAHNVSAYPASVTAEMLKSLVSGQAAISVLARAIHAELTIVDVGVALAEPPPTGVYNERIARGTQDLLTQAAMSAAQTQQALDIGASYARNAITRGADLLIAGEVGIGNTTTATCLLAAITAASADDLVGNGTGITAERRAHKLAVVQRALRRVQGLGNLPPLDLLAELGGFEIAAMTGYYLEAARLGVPCLLDGFISTAAAQLGCAIDPHLLHWLLAAHLSGERGHALALRQLGLVPLVDCGMRLGEGTGAALAVPLIQAALRLHSEMATFATAGVSTACP